MLKKKLFISILSITICSLWGGCSRPQEIQAPQPTNETVENQPKHEAPLQKASVVEPPQESTDINSKAPISKHPYEKILNTFKKTATPQFELFEPGDPAPISYEQYGKFMNLGTNDYQYVITQPEEFKKRIGSGIYPNISGI